MVLMRWFPQYTGNDHNKFANLKSVGIFQFFSGIYFSVLCLCFFYVIANCINHAAF